MHKLILGFEDFEEMLEYADVSFGTGTSIYYADVEDAEVQESGIAYVLRVTGEKPDKQSVWGG